MPSPPEDPATGIPVITDPHDAARRLRAGGVVGIPTETVYGLAACADQPDAIARVFAIKGRPADHPLILHLAAATDLTRWAVDISHEADLLAATCWPGPLTLLLKRSDIVSDAITGGRDTVAIRVPAHRLALEVLAESGPLVAPSANTFGHVSPTSAAHVLSDLGSALDPSTDAILDGGPCEIGVESTILDCTVSPPQVLRHGGISAEDLERLLSQPVAEGSGPQRASGMLASHYAPRIPVLLCETAEEMDAAISASHGRAVAVIDRSSDLVAYAHDLYALLRAAEESGNEVIIARLPPPQGLGHAIRDRLRKAAAPRPGI